MLKRMPWEHNLEIIKAIEPQMRYKGGDFADKDFNHFGGDSIR